VALNSVPLDVHPPNPPWVRLVVDEAAGAYLSIYLSDRLSPVPVRAVTLVGNNKSDPNLETGSFGLFSTCERQMRTSIVAHSIGHIFFLTRGLTGVRQLTGVYRLRWYAASVSPDGKPDWALAADQVHFVAPGIPVDRLPEPSRTVALSRFRNYRRTPPTIGSQLLAALSAKPDATVLYINEIRRLERFNLYFGGFRYIGWRRLKGFDWDAARAYLSPTSPSPDTSAGWAAARNSSPSGRWACEECNAVISAAALLRLCPQCGAPGSLRPNP
jgi:hypothetical protein